MYVLLYSKRDIGPGIKLQEAIRAVLKKNELTICRDLRNFEDCLRRPMCGRGIAVLFAESDNDLSDLFSIQELLMDLSIIFIVPDRAPETLSKAHRFFPRYITSTENDFNDVTMVLERMIRNLEGRPLQGPAELIRKGFEVARGRNQDGVIG